MGLSSYSSESAGVSSGCELVQGQHTGPPGAVEPKGTFMPSGLSHVLPSEGTCLAKGHRCAC